MNIKSNFNIIIKRTIKMNAIKLIDLIKLKDKYTCALMDYHLDRIEEDQHSNVLPKLQ